MSSASAPSPPHASAQEPPPRAPRTGWLLPLTCLLLLATGGAGLVYQVAWVRLLGLTFGVTVYAVSTVLAAFMGGLALGSVVGGRLADRIHNPLRVYGAVEILVGVTALLSPALIGALEGVYRAVALAVDPAQAGLVAGTVRTVLSFAVLLVPTALMGATLPLVVRGVRQAESSGSTAAGDSRAMSWLYALNTAGAIVGSLLSGFVLLGAYGINATILVAALGNLLAGLVALAISRNVGAATVSPAPRPADTRTPVPEEVVSPGLARVAFWVFGISGGVSLAYEVVWSRVLAILFDSSIYGFVLMLATVLLGIATGSAAAGWLVSRHPSALGVGRAFGWVEVGIGLGALFSLVAFGGVYDLLVGLRGTPEAQGVLYRFLRTDDRLMGALCVLTILPASLFMGATFPLAARLWAAGSAGRLGRRLGSVYAANTLGAIAGSLLAGFVLVPALGAHASLLLLALVNVGLGVWLLAATQLGGSVARFGEADPSCVARWKNKREALSAIRGPASARGRSAGWAPVAAGVVGVALVGWGFTRPPVHELVFRQRYPEQDLLWYNAGRENTVSIARNRETGIRTLFTNSRGQSNDEPELVRYYRTLGQLAVLLSQKPDPKVLVVGLGSGVTSGAIAERPAVSLRVVELSESMVAAAPQFRLTNRGLLERPNVTLTVDDGRNWLLRTRERYDVVTADIVQPYDAGSNNLYSAEYFRLASQALAPNGVMIQWVYPNGEFEQKLILRTFLSVFPEVSLWRGDTAVGSLGPRRLDPAKLDRDLADPTTRAALDEIGLRTRDDVLGLFSADDAELRGYVGDGPILTDDRPILEYYLANEIPRFSPKVQFSRDATKAVVAP